MTLLTLNVEPVDIPDQEYDVVLRMHAADVHKICKDFKDASSDIRVQTTDDHDGVIFSCSGDMGSMKWTVNASSPDEGGLEVVQSTATIDEEFPLRQLESMTKSHNMCKRVEMYLTPRQPILLKYTFMRDGQILYLLAPRAPGEMEDD